MEGDLERPHEDNAVVSRNPQMGRKEQLKQCPGCGFVGQTRMEYLPGAWAYCWFWCCMTNWFFAWIIFWGATTTVKQACWDVEHFCRRCDRKLGFQCTMSGLCCCVTSSSPNMPLDGI